jgi:hypothetical protein
MKNYIFKNELKLLINNFKMDLPLDVWRSIILTLKINDIENLSSVNKFFHSLCCERNLWSTKFKEKNLEIINSKINTVGQYISEYKKVSYSKYTASHIVDMIINTKYTFYESMCFFGNLFSIDDLKNILNKDYQIFTKIKEDDFKESISINIKINEKGLINYGQGNKSSNVKTHFYTQNDIDNEYIISLINKILYYYPLITITDIDYIPIIISKNSIIDYKSVNRYRDRVGCRKRYWDECYSKYEELYF